MYSNTDDLVFSEPDMPEGSWKCDKCNNINYPFRTKCNRQNCGADKPSEKKESPTETADANDQVCRVICLHCMIPNFKLFAPFCPMYRCNRAKLLCIQSFYLMIFFALILLSLLKCLPLHFLLVLFSPFSHFMY